MKLIKKILLWITGLIIIVNLIVVVSGNAYVYKAMIYQYAGIDDYNLFENRVVKAGKHIPIPNAVCYNKINLSDEFRKYLLESGTIALLVLKNDSVYYEEYWDGHDSSTISNSFSVAKSIVSILIGIAIDEGKIKSVDQKVSDFIPEYAGGLNEQLSIKHLLTMSAGFDWCEEYESLFGQTTKAYYGRNLKKILLQLKVINTPGKTFVYQSSNQLVLAYILEKVTGMKLSEYASEKLWKPLGAKNDALWSLDKKEGFEKAFCCFNSNARDFSRIGLLYLHGGVYNGQRIISEEYVEESFEPASLVDENGNKFEHYGYSWWLSTIENKTFYLARGILGQYIMIFPDENMVSVRLGKESPEKNGLSACDYIAMHILKEFGNIGYVSDNK
ncbi:MAG: serine hydrolase [Bacteroidales bacterium]|jgi:CubicO group peptidase (beta-lactamase class C family)|nr:beta-lactamase family protein [Bacteroidales bacterium]MDD4214391.1 serine hydrolase [Bacteroidales bacterium]